MLHIHLKIRSPIILPDFSFFCIVCKKKFQINILPKYLLFFHHDFSYRKKFIFSELKNNFYIFLGVSVNSRVHYYSLPSVPGISGISPPPPPPPALPLSLILRSC